MDHIFEINFFDGHPIITSDDCLILVDTGAPISIHIENTLLFCQNNYPCSTDYFGFDIDRISELLGKRITTLLGADILSKYLLQLDYKHSIAAFSSPLFHINGVETPIEIFMGIPIIELLVNGQWVKFFLDTGAKRSYLPANFTNSFEILGVDEDFFPMVGNFRTPLYEINTRLDEHEFKVQYGNLPTSLEMTLSMSGVKGVMGYDFFNHFKVAIDLKNGLLTYERQWI
jgi:hypothetical protein